MHLAPNLYLCVAAVMVMGYFSGFPTLYTDFYSNCRQDYWKDLLFIQNLFKDLCYNSTWSIATEYQFYILGLPLIVLYCYSRLATALILVLLIVGTLAFRYYIMLTFPYVDFEVRELFTPYTSKLELQSFLLAMMSSSYFRVRCLLFRHVVIRDVSFIAQS